MQSELERRPVDISSLPRAQQVLWPELEGTPGEFVLYGGTAVALQLAHRVSVDFDFFSNHVFDPEHLLRQIPYLHGSQMIDFKENTLSCVVDRDEPVHVSLFGGLDLNRVANPWTAEDNGIKIASLVDLAGTKAAVVMKRATWKDYVDLHALMQSGVRLEEALAAGAAIYGNRFEPMIALKALSYHEDVDLSGVDAETAQQFTKAVACISGAVKRIDLANLPSLAARGGLLPDGEK